MADHEQIVLGWIVCDIGMGMLTRRIFYGLPLGIIVAILVALWPRVY
jgi:hypothetical protein